MKKIYGFAALCAAMTLASCSNNDEPVVNPVSGESVTAGYLSVNIASTNGTRAAHNNYVSGTEGESKAKTATFVFFNASGAFVTCVPDQDLTSTTGYTEQNIERDYNVMVPVSVTLPDGTAEADKDAVTANLVNTIKKVVVILNPDATINAAVNGKNESKVLEVAANYATTGANSYTSDNKFVMTNSVYVDGSNNIVYAQDVDSKIKNSAVDATAEPLDLYVERVVARVDVRAKDGGIEMSVPEIAMIDYNDSNELESKDTKLNLVITGVELANVANQSYLVKNLDESWKTAGRFNGWNDVIALRSHWAQSWTSLAAVLDPSRTLAAASQTDPNQTYFANKAWQASGFNYNGNALPDAVKKYINENTNENYPTSLVVSAQLVNEDGDGVNLVRICRNGKYYSEEGAMDLLADMLKREGYYVKYGVEVVNNADGTTTTKNLYRNLTPADLVLKSDVELGVKDAVGYEGYLSLKTGTPTTDANGHKVIFTDADVYKTTDGGVTFAEVDSFSTKVLQDDNYKVWKWNEGKCYYYIALNNGEEDTTATVEDGEALPKINGVVRNHIYDIDITKIAGLGVPVFNPNDIIVPITPEKIDPKDEWSLACDIHILSWVKYHQDAEFNQGAGDTY